MSDGATAPDPVVHRRRLRMELRKAREAAGKRQREVAAAMDWSLSKLMRIETGAFNISTNDLRALLDLYRVNQARVRALVDLAQEARKVPRWNIYKDVTSPEHIAFLGYESSASIIRNFEPWFIPALLQTEEYAQEAIGAIEYENPMRVDALTDLRIERQEILAREPAPNFYFIMDEAAIRRTVGGREAMRRQLLHLLKIAEYPHVSIRVIPFSAGAYQRPGIPYTLFEFPDPEDEHVLYLENPLGSFIVGENFLSGRQKVSPINYLEIFWRLEQISRREDLPRCVDRVLSDLDTD